MFVKLESNGSGVGRARGVRCRSIVPDHRRLHAILFQHNVLRLIEAPHTKVRASDGLCKLFKDSETNQVPVAVAHDDLLTQSRLSNHAAPSEHLDRHMKSVSRKKIVR